MQKRREKAQKEKEDRDKTLEPDYPSTKLSSTLNPLLKSTTTANITDIKNYSSQKERTPYRVDRNKNKYLESDLTTFKPTSSTTSKRTELGLSNGIQNGYNSGYSKTNSNDSGYYDQKPVGKENIYKSKYDPDVLLSEIAGSNLLKSNKSAGNSSRQLKSYKRTDSGDRHRTAINLYDLDDDHRYRSTKPTTHYNRSETQKFFEEEKHTEKTPVDPIKADRENRKLEIQNLLMKYAQMDDFYGKTSLDYGDKPKDVNNSIWDPNSHFQSPIVIPQKTAKQSSQTQMNPLLKSQTMASITSNGANGTNGAGTTTSRYNKYYNYYDNIMSNINNVQNQTNNNISQSNNNVSSNRTVNYNSNNNLLSITTSTGNLNAPAPRSRMSKALSTFVR